VAKGLRQHQERLEALGLLGKVLARRATSQCELCESGGVPLKTFEVPPVPVEPSLDHCLLLCETCLGHIGRPDSQPVPRWRCLNNTVWSEIPAVQVTAVRILRSLEGKEAWAKELLEQVYPEPDIIAWVES